MKKIIVAILIGILALFVVATPTYAFEGNPPPIEFPGDDYTTSFFGGPGTGGGGNGGGGSGGGGGPAPLTNGHPTFNLFDFLSQTWNSLLQLLR